MIDRYTRVVLTVIALALSAIAVGQFTPRAQAQSRACGDVMNPCYVRTTVPMQVYVVH